MFTFVTHCIYAVVLMYGYKAVEAYKAQIALNVPKKKALKNSLIWPKNLIK